MVATATSVVRENFATSDHHKLPTVENIALGRRIASTESMLLTENTVVAESTELAESIASVPQLENVAMAQGLVVAEQTGTEVVVQRHCSQAELTSVEVAPY